MSSSLPLEQPLRFRPWFRPAAWGGRALGRFLGKNLPPEVAVGESWEVSDHPSHASVLASGPLFRQTLRQLMERHRDELLGPAAPRHERFPWLIKLLDCHDWLSVQVHPDEEAVRRLLPHECSKTEAWVIIDARPGSRVYAGLRPGVGPAELRAALARGAAAECLHHFEPRPGDVVFLPAGTVHAVGGGVLMGEIQQTSDATFRLYDWDRTDAAGQARPLHVEQALASIDWTQGPVAPRRPGGSAPLLCCPYFRCDALAADREVVVGGTGHLQALIVTGGQGRLDNGEFVMAGDAWILPARMAPLTLHVEAPLSGLLCSLP